MIYLRNLGLAALAAMALLAFIGTAASSATTLEIGGVAQNKSVEFFATLEPETSLVLKDSSGTTTETCSESEFKGKTEGSFTAASVAGKLTLLAYRKCSHTSTVLSNGSLAFAWISGTTNATVTSSGAEITMVSTAFGVSAVCKTGAGTDFGTLTGATTASNSSAHATLDLNAKISCGILGTATWTGSYKFTSPTDLGFVS